MGWKDCVRCVAKFLHLLSPNLQLIQYTWIYRRLLWINFCILDHNKPLSRVVSLYTKAVFDTLLANRGKKEPISNVM